MERVNIKSQYIRVFKKCNKQINQDHDTLVSLSKYFHLGKNQYLIFALGLLNISVFDNLVREHARTDKTLGTPQGVYNY